MSGVGPLRALVDVVFDVRFPGRLSNNFARLLIRHRIVNCSGKFGDYERYSLLPSS